MDHHELTYTIKPFPALKPGEAETHIYESPVNVREDWTVQVRRFYYRNHAPDQRIGVAAAPFIGDDGLPRVRLTLTNVSEETFDRGFQIVRVDLDRPVTE